MNTNNRGTSLLFLLPGLCYLTEYLIWRSFPQSYTLNGILGALWTVGQSGILLLLFELNRRFLSTGAKGKMTGIVLAAAGALSYIINYVFGYWFHLNTKLFLPLGALLTGIGMTIVGIQILMARRWHSAFCFTPLLVGLYPFAVMFPLVLITGRPDLTAILGWGIPWLLLGIGLARLRNSYTPVKSIHSPAGRKA